MVIAQIDDYFYDASRLTLLKNILDDQADDYEELFNIETTTSIDASDMWNVELEEDPILDKVKENTKEEFVVWTRTVHETIKESGNWKGKVLNTFQIDYAIQKRPKYIRLPINKRTCSNLV